MSDGRSLDDFSRQQRQKRERKKAPVRKKGLVHKHRHILTKGIRFEGHPAALVKKHLLRYSEQVDYISNLKRWNDTYRTSI